MHLMLDIKFIRENAERVKEFSAQKGYVVNVDELLRLDEQRLSLLQSIETLRAERNEVASQMKQTGGKPDEQAMSEGKRIKLELAEREAAYDQIDGKWLALLKTIPNIHADDVPVGDEHQSVEISRWGSTESGATDHLDFMNARGWVDFERGAKVAGAKFYFLKGDGALLENAITQFALSFVTQKGFTLMSVPHMVNTKTALGAGFAPKNSDSSNEYFIDGEDLTLIGTAEAPLTGYHSDEIINEADLPLLYAGYSPCYRREAGTYGKHTRGLFRVHQFNKLEMYAFALPEQSAHMHQTILQIEEELWRAIGIPYRVINIATGDLGAPAYKKYDIEYWSPVDGAYRELTSCSNCTDFQARGLNIRVRRASGEVETLHTLNGTAVALARSIVAIVEHFQQADGTLAVPEVLRPYLGGREIL